MEKLLSMLGLPSPAALLGVTLAVLISAIAGFGVGAYGGVKWERNDTLARIAVAQDTAIKAANAAVAAETERAVAREKAAATARAKAREIRHQGELDAAKKSRPECSRDAVSMGLLNNAIDTANGGAHTGTGMRETMRPAGETVGWLGAIVEKLGVSGGGTVWRMPAAP